jgi:hypothetical protein
MKNRKLLDKNSLTRSQDVTVLHVIYDNKHITIIMYMIIVIYHINHLHMTFTYGV